ncbi:ABC transporter substrate-binding protein [Saccharothrix deserti]|uniref:ABC transporter substrate-binding protein n=1 Tax=Saccharothrix deserti TaxID=2593674 RepID=UPI00131B5124|nr:ABC transporter substrate-binding protein [Saccharothrix deserti]
MNNPLFRGVHALLSVARSLVDRPRWRLRPGRSDLRGDRPLPLLCLIRDSGRNPVLEALYRHLDRAVAPRKRKVPFAYVDAARAAEDARERWSGVEREVPLLPLLDVLHRRLLSDRFGEDRLSCFRHYRLVDWLTGQRLPPGDRRDDRTVVDLLRDWHAVTDSSAAAEQHAAVAQTVAQSALERFLVAVFLAWHRPLRFWLWVHGAPLVGREPRWLMRQPFMVPGHSTSFTGFAERLTVGRRDEENLEQLKKLLVHAFLQDLRLAYRPRGLRLRRWRRTAYTVVLLEGITEENGGWELLRIINDVRNESTQHDPVLVIATAERKPDDLQPGRPVAPVSRIKAELDAWVDGLPAHRQSLRPDARFVFAWLPPQVDDDVTDSTLSQDDESAWHDLGRFQPRRPPLAARKPVVVAVVGVVLVAGLLTGGRWGLARAKHDCLPDPRAGVAVRWIEGTKSCVGYSDSAAHVFSSDKRLRAVQLAVFELNAVAERLHEENPVRAMVSVVYFADLTHSMGDPGADASVAEELEGVLIRQKAQNKQSASEPLLRVVVANGGDQMKAARTVVDDLLAPLLADDPSIVGVIGMGLTVLATESAIGALGDLGTPVLATSLTGEALGERSPLYFQLVPGNRVQAALIAGYARSVGKPVTVYHPRRLSDNYLESLVGELGAAIDGEPAVRLWNQRVGEVEIVCGQQNIAFYAGREGEFAGFLKEVVGQCGNDRPVVIGDDAVSRFVAQGSLRSENEFKGIPVSYVSMGARVVLAGPDCLSKGEPAVQTVSSGSEPGARPLVAFCAGHHELRDPTTGSGRVAEFARLLAEPGDRMSWPGERIGVAYDAASLFVEAVRNNQNRERVPNPDQASPRTGPAHTVHRAAVAQELREPNKFEGATGRIDFAASRTGLTRPLAILTIDDIHDLGQVPKCVHEISLPVNGSTHGPLVTADC